MFGRRERREERMYWEGFRDALVRGIRNPGRSISGSAVAEQPRYPQGFEDGLQAAKRIHRDALVDEVRKLSLQPGDKLVVRCSESLNSERIEYLTETLKPRFPDNEILVLERGDELAVIRPVSIVVKTVLDGKVVAEAVAKGTEDEAARG